MFAWKMNYTIQCFHFPLTIIAHAFVNDTIKELLLYM